MKYTKARAEIVMFDNSDVITGSLSLCALGSNGDGRLCVESIPGVSSCSEAMGVGFFSAGWEE